MAIEIDFMEAVNGCQKTISFNRIDVQRDMPVPGLLREPLQVPHTSMRLKEIVF